jgi:hypothetical protein
MKEKPALTNPDEFPDAGVVRKALGESYVLYEEIMNALTGDPLNLEPVWRYYKDGHAWLCKVIHKKKTVLWLSVLDGYFKAAFYFSAKAGEGIPGLDIDEALIANFQKADFIGKIKPLIITVRNKAQVSDTLTIAGYKKKA